MSASPRDGVAAFRQAASALEIFPRLPGLGPSSHQSILPEEVKVSPRHFPVGAGRKPEHHVTPLETFPVKRHLGVGLVEGHAKPVPYFEDHFRVTRKVDEVKEGAVPPPRPV